MYYRTPPIAPPIIRVRAGETLTLVLKNKMGGSSLGIDNHNDFRLPNTTNLHLHGVHMGGGYPGDEYVPCFCWLPVALIQLQSDFPSRIRAQNTISHTERLCVCLCACSCSCSRSNHFVPPSSNNTAVEK
mmetsp:Transcript_15897/g.32576  ORF Transcript_15897/g.32576 Transcript_15897/m.32576 type:complete len:130 (-) Transcript_15897:158-547(-)